VSVWPERRRPPVQALMARAVAWLVEPAAPDGGRSWAPPLAPGPPEPAPPGATRLEPVPPQPASPEPTAPHPDPPRPLVAVLGLAPGAGATTIARAVAARLAAFDPLRAAILHTAHSPWAVPASAPAARLARTLVAAGIGPPRAAGRLCVLDAGEPLAPLAASRPAPVVADLAHGQPADGAIALADHVVLVAPPDVEPALASAVVTSLRANGVSASTVLNRATGDPPPDLGHALAVPESRLAAQLTLACREFRGPVAAVAAELAERSLAEVWR
jgi:hypothetical protein